MKLTPLGKLLLFLIGLALVGTAIWKFAPPEMLAKLRGLASKSERPSSTSTTEPRSETRVETRTEPRPDRPAGPEDEVIKCMMPLTTTFGELDEGLSILEAAMADVFGEAASKAA